MLPHTNPIDGRQERRNRLQSNAIVKYLIYYKLGCSSEDLKMTMRGVLHIVCIHIKEVINTIFNILNPWGNLLLTFLFIKTALKCARVSSIHSSLEVYVLNRSL